MPCTGNAVPGNVAPATECGAEHRAASGILDSPLTTPAGLHCRHPDVFDGDIIPAWQALTAGP